MPSFTNSGLSFTWCNWSVMLVLHRSRLAAVLRGWPVYLASPCPCPLPPRRGARRSLLAPGRIGTAKRAGVLLLRVHAGLGVNFCSAFRPDGCPAAAVGVSGLDFLGVFHEAFWISSVLEQVSEPYAKVVHVKFHKRGWVRHLLLRVLLLGATTLVAAIWQRNLAKPTKLDMTTAQALPPTR